jgi:dolichyl-phosphate-mannose-protein mannosyltransferase
VLSVIAIGIAVLVDLWDLLDIQKNPSMVSVIPRCLPHYLISSQEHFWRHFGARAFGLIVIPIIVYLSFFWVHFALLTHSGAGDSFMSPRFQESLIGNEMLMHSIGNFCFLEWLPGIYSRPRAQVL